MLDGEDKWQAENDLRTLRRAHEIVGDKSRLALARQLANEELAAVRALSSPLSGPEEEKARPKTKDALVEIGAATWKTK
jgi:hypothetical protein